MKYIKNGRVINATEKAYRVLYKRKGYKPMEEAKEVLTNDLEGYTNKELKSMLDTKGIEYNSRATKAELIELLEG